MDFPILKVVQKYLKTVSRGSGHWAVCPFHQDTSPSLSISESKNIFKCFACNVSGNAVGFVMKLEKCGYVEAVKKIGEILGIDVRTHLNQKQNKLYDLHKFNEHIAKHYHKCLFNSSEESKSSLRYLTEERKLSLETIKKYRIGFAPTDDDLNMVVEMYKEKTPVSQETIVESQLFIQLGKGEKKPFFRNRIIFPILDEDGNVIGFSGRGEEPKYLNLKNNIAFIKAQTLFNVQYLEEDAYIYLFEGFIDVIKSSQELDLKNCLACMGGLLDESVMRVLKKYTQTIVLCLDNDAAGREFTRKVGEKLIFNGFEVLVVNFLDSKYKDVDEMIDNDPEYIRERALDPIPFFAWIYECEKPKELTEIKNLVDRCLPMFTLRGHILSPTVNLEYAKFLTEEMFGWYCNHESWNNIRDEIGRAKKILLEDLERSFVNPKGKTTVDNKDEFIKLHAFERIGVRYGKLIDYILHNSVQYYPSNEWKYTIPDRFRDDKLKWLFDKLDAPETKVDIPENLSKFRNMEIPINNHKEFFNKYYSFYIEYLDAWGEEMFSQYYRSFPDRLNDKWSARRSASLVRTISSNFFRKNKFGKS